MSTRRHWREHDPFEEIHDFLRQRHISPKNVEQLQRHAQSDDPELRRLADLVLDIARVKPGRKRRAPVLATRHWPLFLRCVAMGDDAVMTLFPGALEHANDPLFSHVLRAERELELRKDPEQP